MNTVEIIEPRELLDFVVLFETEPEWVNEAGWYVGARFVTRRDADHLTATIAPTDLEFDLLWIQDGVQRASLELTMVSDWRIERSAAFERLVLKVSRGRVSRDHEIEYPALVVIQFKPFVSIEWHMPWGGV